MKITYEFIERKEFSPFFRELREMIFKNDLDIFPHLFYTQEEKDKLNTNYEVLKGVDSYHLVAKNGDEIVGWSFGVQKTDNEYYMINSAVYPEYRQKGIYTEMMKKAVTYISEKGYQKIYSRHKMSNNAILIPKLKFGFVITGMEVTDTFGNLLELSYFTNEKRRQILEFRMGTRKLDNDILKLIQ